ncbi:MAG: hypothetical protein KDA25_07895 [Phycisphaerales bacterium]|nr:hypothetical protein [Phycisphaerales bacterium]
MSTSRVIIAVAVTAALGLSFLSGCGAKEPDPVVIQQRPPVDPRFATAEAFVDHLNVVANELVNVNGIQELMYGETPDQRRFIEALGGLTPMLDLFAAARDHFGEDAVREMAEQQAAMPLFGTTIRLVAQNDRRADAVSTAPDGQESTLKLVEIDDRWWISGYTFDHDPDARKMMDNPAALEQMGDMMRQVCPPIVNNIRAGRYSTVERMQNELGMSIMAYIMAHPEVMEGMNDGEAPPFGGRPAGGPGGR